MSTPSAREKLIRIAIQIAMSKSPGDASPALTPF
jgi:hypothetical protein